jgi:hypothetical protein
VLRGPDWSCGGGFEIFDETADLSERSTNLSSPTKVSQIRSFHMWGSEFALVRPGHELTAR